MSYPKSTQPLPKHAKKVFDGIIFSIWQWEQEMYDGSIQTFEKSSRAASVGIIPITKDKKIVLTIQEQPGMNQFISLLGGVVDPGEKEVEAAHREIKEEAGLVTSDLELWYSVQPVTKIEWPIYIYIARDCEIVAPPNPDAGEKISLKYVTWEEFLDIIYLEEFRDKEIALRLLQLQKDPDKLEEVRKLLFK
jgi:ADP-ribose pyrophosphatase